MKGEIGVIIVMQYNSNKVNTVGLVLLLFFYYSSVNFNQITVSLDIPLLIFLSVLLQVEDAMLMFDKTTNRHRGKSPFVLCVSVCVFACVCNVIMNVLQLYCAVSRAVQSYALKQYRSSCAVCYIIALYLQGHFIWALKVKANMFQ